VVYWDRETTKTYKFLTNDFEREALVIAKIYKARWDIELFFKWIKQNLKIKTFLGTSKNAVMMQIWIAMIVYLLIWYIAKQAKKIKGVLELTRIFREMLFENMSIIDLLAKKFRSEINLKPPDNQQLILFQT
jgi:IS4 transposase